MLRCSIYEEHESDRYDVQYSGPRGSKRNETVVNVIKDKTTRIKEKIVIIYASMWYIRVGLVSTVDETRVEYL